MDRVLMAKAGKWSIISGALVTGFGAFYLLFVVLAYTFSPNLNIGMVSSKEIAPGVFLLIYGVFVLASGFFARRGERWWLAFAGSIFSLPLAFLGAVAGILLVRARDDWPKMTRWLIYGILSICGFIATFFWFFMALA